MSEITIEPGGTIPDHTQPVEYPEYQPPTPQEFDQELARRLIITLDFHVLTSVKSHYSPHDQLRSAYNLKRNLSDFGGMHLDTKVYTLIVQYVKEFLSPFLVSWHPTLFDPATFIPGAYTGECQGIECKDVGVLRLFDTELNTLREKTAELREDLKGVLDDRDYLEKCPH